MSTSNEPHWIQNPRKEDLLDVFTLPNGQDCLYFNQRRSEHISPHQKYKGGELMDSMSSVEVLHRLVWWNSSAHDYLRWLYLDQWVSAFGPASAKSFPSTDKLAKEEEDENVIKRRRTEEGKPYRIIIGVSVKVCSEKDSPNEGQLISIHLCTYTKAISIPVASLIPTYPGQRTTKESFAALRNFFSCEQIHFVGLHAGAIATWISTVGMRIHRIYDAASLLEAEERMNLTALAIHFADNTEAVEDCNVSFVAHRHEWCAKMGDYARVELHTAYLCALVALWTKKEYAYASTSNTEPGLLDAYARLLRNQKIGQDELLTQHILPFDGNRSGKVQGSDSQDDVFRLYCALPTHITSPSSSYLLELGFNYHYFAEADTVYENDRGDSIPVQQGELKPGVYCEMYGQVVERHEDYVDVRFPVGAYATRKMLIIPAEVHLPNGSENLSFHPVPDPQSESRLQLLTVRLLENTVPTPKEQKTYRYILDMLACV